MLTYLMSILKSFVSTKECIDLRTGGHADDSGKVCFTKCLTHYKSTKIRDDYKTFSPLRPIVITPNKAYNIETQLIWPMIKQLCRVLPSLYKQSNVTTIRANTSGMLSDMFESSDKMCTYIV
jgi:hypothetical protein